MTNVFLDYLQLGYSVIPLGKIVLNKKGQKEISYPVLWKQFQTRHPTEHEALSWKRYTNVGIITGKLSGLLVLDLDSYKPEYDKEFIAKIGLPITPVQTTARGGRQYFFKFPKGLELSNDVGLAIGVDIRAEGGMCVVAPTKTAYGEYSWVISPFESPLADVPEELLKLIKEHNSANGGHKKNLVDLVEVKEGGRDSSMASLAGKLALAIKPEYWVRDIWPVMNAVNKTYSPPLELRDLKRIFDSITGIEQDRRTKQAPVSNQSLSFKQLMETDFPELRYTIEPFFEQGTVNMVTAPPNNWKSWLLFLFSMHISRGTPVMENFEVIKSNVMIVNEEDSLRLVQDRFKLLGAEGEYPIHFRVANGAKLDDALIDALLKEAKEKDIGVIMFDSLRSLHTSNENDSQEMQAVMDFLKRLARENITVIFTHHHRKKNAFNKQDDAEASRGSSGINASISGHISLEEEIRENGTFIVVHHLKSKAGEKLAPFEIEIKKEKQDDVVVGIKFLYSGEFKKAEQKLELTKDAILKALPPGVWKTVKDFEQLQISSKRTISQGLAMLKIKGLIVSMTRKQVKEKGILLETEGSPRENVYSFNEGVHEEEVTNDPLDTNW